MLSHGLALWVESEFFAAVGALERQADALVILACEAGCLHLERDYYQLTANSLADRSSNSHPESGLV